MIRLTVEKDCKLQFHPALDTGSGSSTAVHLRRESKTGSAVVFTSLWHGRVMGK